VAVDRRTLSLVHTIDLSSPTYMIIISVHVIDELSEIDGCLDRTLSLVHLSSIDSSGLTPMV
jgi:hypothetical protein